MQLILAIDSDPRRSVQLAALVRAAKLRVELVQATSAGEGLHALKDRVPDLILTSPLLSPFDDGVLDEYLRDLGSSATHVQTVRIPMLSAPSKKKSAASRLFGLGRMKKQTSPASPDGCDPTVFADEIAHYLTRSLEERTAFSQSASDGAPQCEPEPVVQPAGAAFALRASAPGEWDAPEALIAEFRSPIEPARQPIEAAPVVEETYVPGSILDLRLAPPKSPGEGGTPIVHAPVEPELAAVESAPPFDFAQGRPFDSAQGRQAFIAPEPLAYFHTDPSVNTEPSTYVMPEPTYVKPEPVLDSAQGRPANVEDVKRAHEPPIVEPAPVSAPATTTGNSPSFEAALAAIRAAWVKPDAKKDEPMPPNGGSNGRPATLGAGSAEVDLTNEIDALEDVAGIDGQTPAADTEPSPGDVKTPARREPGDKSKKRQEKGRGGRARGADGRDEWGVFDPNQCGFSALVNKLDEVTEDDVPATDAKAR